MKGEWELVQQSPVWAVDAWGMGCLMQEGFSGRPLSRTEDLRNTRAIPQAVLQVELTSPQLLSHESHYSIILVIRESICWLE